MPIRGPSLGVLGDIWIDPYGSPWPQDQLPRGIPRSDLLTLAEWPSVPAQNPLLDWGSRFTLWGEDTKTDPNLIALIRARARETTGTMERPSTSVLARPAAWKQAEISGLGGFGMDGGLGSWISKKIDKKRKEDAKEFMLSRKANKVAIVVGGPAGGFIQASAVARKEKARDDDERRRARAAAEVPPDKVAKVLEAKEPVPTEKIAAAAIVCALQEGASNQGIDVKAYMEDSRFRKEAMVRALSSLESELTALLKSLRDNRLEQQILKNELDQVRTDGEVKPIPGALPAREIVAVNAEATKELMANQGIPPVRENIEKVVPEVTAEWERNQVAQLEAAKAEEKLLKGTIENVEEAKVATQGVTEGLVMGKEWGRGSF